MRKADNLPPYRAVVKKSRSLNFLDPSGPAWPVTRVLYLYLYIYIYMAEAVIDALYKLVKLPDVISNPHSRRLRFNYMGKLQFTNISVTSSSQSSSYCVLC